MKYCGPYVARRYRRFKMPRPNGHYLRFLGKRVEFATPRNTNGGLELVAATFGCKSLARALAVFKKYEPLARAQMFERKIRLYDLTYTIGAAIEYGDMEKFAVENGITVVRTFKDAFTTSLYWPDELLDFQREIGAWGAQVRYERLCKRNVIISERNRPAREAEERRIEAEKAEFYRSRRVAGLLRDYRLEPSRETASNARRQLRALGIVA